MSLKNLSKQAFATALEQMVQTKPIEKIRVTHLSKVVGTTPQTFYYHFQDKYDLIAWIYLQDYIDIVKNHAEHFSPQQIVLMMAKFESRKTFYQKAFTDKSQNAIETYANQHSITIAKKAVEQSQQAPLTTQQKIAIIYHQYGVTGLFIDWIFNRSDMDIQQLAEFQYQQAPDFLKEALKNFLYEDYKDN
ncbi:TetR/AcrR family transcriptional regulator C-terminal domain-containing protein [Enterococcus casseliflavus]|uniref:TetR/AcrR family transcriptional regulator C-terminal domain-containing protein n=1 Tax=Enterococcus casseliflavus TaxID=37734 RepID=UPI0035E0BDC6